MVDGWDVGAAGTGGAMGTGMGAQAADVSPFLSTLTMGGACLQMLDGMVSGKDLDWGDGLGTWY